MITLIFGKRGSGKSYLANELTQNEKRLIILDYIGEYDGTICTNETDIINNVRSNPNSFRLVVRLQEERENLFKILYCITNYTLLIEELSLYANTYAINDDLKKILEYGRHRKINIVGISRTPFEISKRIRSQVDIIYSFKMTEPKDIDYLENYGLHGIDKLSQYENAKIEL